MQPIHSQLPIFSREPYLPKAAKLFLIRHGETDWNAEQRIQGSIERPLNETGIEQVSMLAKGMVGLNCSIIYSSPMVRARQTAEIICSHIPCKIFIESDLREGSFGAAEGLTKEEYHSQFTKEIAERDNLPFHEKIHFKIVPDGESVAELAFRSIKTLNQICKNHIQGEVIVVTHGFVMRALMVYLGRYEQQEILVSNAAILRLDGTGEKLHIIDHLGVTFKSC